MLALEKTQKSNCSFGEEFKDVCGIQVQLFFEKQRQCVERHVFPRHKYSIANILSPCIKKPHFIAELNATTKAP